MASTARAGEAERAARRLLVLLQTGETALHCRDGTFVLRRPSPSASRQEVSLARSLVEFCLA